jgi:hypothetical protein
MSFGAPIDLQFFIFFDCAASFVSKPGLGQFLKPFKRKAMRIKLKQASPEIRAVPKCQCHVPYLLILVKKTLRALARFLTWMEWHPDRPSRI